MLIRFMLSPISVEVGAHDLRRPLRHHPPFGGFLEPFDPRLSADHGNRSRRKGAALDQSVGNGVAPSRRTLTPETSRRPAAPPGSPAQDSDPAYLLPAPPPPRSSTSGTCGGGSGRGGGCTGSGGSGDGSPSERRSGATWRWASLRARLSGPRDNQPRSFTMSSRWGGGGGSFGPVQV